VTFYAINPSVSPSAFNGSGFGFESSVPQVRTPRPQARPAPTKRAHTQFSIVTGYLTNFFDHSTRAATAPIAPATVGWDELETAHIVSETIYAATADAENGPQRDVDRIAGERMLLLARKYADLHSPETIARLEKLNGLLLEISPRVSDEQVASLQRSHALLQRADSARFERARRRAMQSES
jgi:hypothetical protein